MVSGVLCELETHSLVPTTPPHTPSQQCTCLVPLVPNRGQSKTRNVHAYRPMQRRQIAGRYANNWENFFVSDKIISHREITVGRTFLLFSGLCFIKNGQGSSVLSQIVYLYTRSSLAFMNSR